MNEPASAACMHTHDGSPCCAGRLSADIIAGRPQPEQAKELSSFAVLNIAWSSIVKLLMVLAKGPDANAVAKGMFLHRCGL